MTFSNYPDLLYAWKTAESARSQLAPKALKFLHRWIKQVGRCFGLRPAPPVEHFRSCLGLKCFSDTRIGISFDVVNALKMPPDHRSVDRISDARPLVGSVMAD